MVGFAGAKTQLSQRSPQSTRTVADASVQTTKHKKRAQRQLRRFAARRFRCRGSRLRQSVCIACECVVGESDTVSWCFEDCRHSVAPFAARPEPLACVTCLCSCATYTAGGVPRGGCFAGVSLCVGAFVCAAGGSRCGTLSQARKLHCVTKLVASCPPLCLAWRAAVSTHWCVRWCTLCGYACAPMTVSDAHCSTAHRTSRCGRRSSVIWSPLPSKRAM